MVCGQIASTPQELEFLLESKLAENYSARMTAGYCWPWSNPLPHDTLVADVVIGDWARPWNVKSDRAVGSALWATQDGGFGQVGCVYTAQGFEYDWNGVILGPDLVIRDGHFVPIRSATRDPIFNKNIPDTESNRLIRNTYKVLLTRGMIGTVVYSTDPETREFLSHLASGS